MVYKRPRSVTASDMAKAYRRKTMAPPLSIRRIPSYKRGYLRTSGFYGRYNRPMSALGGELKFVDTTLAGTNFPTAGVIAYSSLNVVAQGAAQNQRVGRQITIKALQIQGRATANASITTPSIGRMIVYLDTQTNGAAATVGQILASASYSSYMNLEYTPRFRIIYDKRFEFNPTVADGVAFIGQNYSVNLYKKCNIKIDYDNTLDTGVIATQRTNNIGVLLIGSSNDQVSFNGTCRIRFAD